MNKTTETILIVAAVAGTALALYTAYQAKLAAVSAGRSTAPTPSNAAQLDYAGAVETFFAQLWPAHGGTPETATNGD